MVVDRVVPPSGKRDGHERTFAWSRCQLCTTRLTMDVVALV